MAVVTTLWSSNPSPGQSPERFREHWCLSENACAPPIPLCSRYLECRDFRDSRYPTAQVLGFDPEASHGVLRDFLLHDARAPAIPAAEREELWWCCGECRSSGMAGLVLVANMGAFLAVGSIMPIAAHLGVHNQVAVFYGSTPVAILLWWYLVGSLKESSECR